MEFCEKLITVDATRETMKKFTIGKLLGLDTQFYKCYNCLLDLFGCFLADVYCNKQEDRKLLSPAERDVV